MAGTGDGPRTLWPLAFLPEKIGEGLVGPILPIFAASFAGASPARIGVMEAAFQATAVLGAFAWGRTSDRSLKRKPFILLAFLGAGVSLAGMAAAASFWGLFAWRTAYGFLAAGFAAVGGALVADRSTPEAIGDRLGLLRAVGGFGYVGGLVAGGLILLARPPADLFALAALLAVLSALTAWLSIDEPTSFLDRREVADLLRSVGTPISMGVQRRLFNPTVFLHRPRLEGTERRAWAYLAAIAIAFVGTTAGFVLFPLYLDQIGVPPAWIFGLFVLNGALSALLYRPMGRWADRLGYRRMQVGALGARSGMFLVLLVPALAGLPGAIVFLALAGISWAVIHVTGPAALFHSMRIREKGELIGLYQGAAGIGSLAGALVGGWVAGTAGFGPLFALSAGLVALSVPILLFAVYPAGREKPRT